MLSIVLFHYAQKIPLPDLFQKLILFGGTGIHLFILLSGFGLYLSFSKRPLSYGLFIKKRLSKIYIPYIIVVLISALIALFIPIYENSWYALGGHALLYKMFDERIVGSYGYQLWFVSMILQFYFTFHLIVWLKKQFNNWSFLLISLVISLTWAVVVFYLGKESLRIWNSFFLQYLWEFSLGMVLASYYASGKLEKVALRTYHYLILGLIGCAAYAAMALKGGEVGRLFNDIPALIGYACLAIVLFRFKIDWLHRFMVYSGGISFSLFLLHMLFLELFVQLLPTQWLTLSLLLAFGLTYLACHYFQKGIGMVYKYMQI